MQLAQLREERLQLNSTMFRRVRRESADRFCQLTFHPDPASAPGLVPGDCDVHQPLQEVALPGRRGTPCILQLLVRREVLAGADQGDAAVKP